MKLINSRKKVVTLAVASALSGVAMVSAPAYAANVAQTGLGELLLFPYYTVRNGYDTLLSVTNTSDSTVLFKIRFREAKNSREVRDFNVALSPRDVWTAGVTINGTDGALVRTFDKSCTSPKLPDGPVFGTEQSKQIEFTTLGYDGSDAQFIYDNGGRNPNRVQEGYFEIIEMTQSSVPESAISASTPIEFATQHVNGVPRDCDAFDLAFAPLNLADTALWGSFVAPANVLMGNATLINVPSGKAADASPTAIQGFQDAVPIIFEPGDLLPDVADGSATEAQMFVDGQLVTINVGVGADPSVEVVSALLTANLLVNEFAAGSTETSSAATDWVVTFPTKHKYTDNPLAPFPQTDVRPPFAQAFQPTGQSCDTITVSLNDREERTQININSTQFSPRPSGPGGVALCNEVNVVNFANGATPAPVLGSSVQLGVNTSGVGSSGWAAINLTIPPTNPLWTATGLTGLPVIGFNVIDRNNSVDAGNNRNYASGNDHTKVIAPPAP